MRRRPQFFSVGADAPGSPAGSGGKTTKACGEFADSTSSPYVFPYDHYSASGRRGVDPYTVGGKAAEHRPPVIPSEAEGSDSLDARAVGSLDSGFASARDDNERGLSA